MLRPPSCQFTDAGLISSFAVLPKHVFLMLLLFIITCLSKIMKTSTQNGGKIIMSTSSAYVCDFILRLDLSFTLTRQITNW